MRKGIVFTVLVLIAALLVSCSAEPKNRLGEEEGWEIENSFMALRQSMGSPLRVSE